MPSAPNIRIRWELAVLPGLIPLVVAASLTYLAAEPPAASADVAARVLGMLAGFELVRVFAFQVLAMSFGATSRAQALRRFFIGYAIVLFFFLGIIFSSDHGRASIAEDFSGATWRIIGLQVLLIAADAAIGLWFFVGDPRVERARLEAAADDMFDLYFLTVYAAFFMLAALVLISAFQIDEHAGLFRASFLGLAAAYFVMKAALLVYPRSRRFARTGRRLLDPGWIQLALTWDRRKRDRRVAAEQVKAAERRTLLGGEAQAAVGGQA